MIRHSTPLKAKKRHAFLKRIACLFSLGLARRIGWEFVQFFLQMCDDAVPAQSVVLLVDIPHYFSIANGIEAVADMPLILLIKPVSQQGHHCQLQRFLILHILLEPLVVLPGDQAKDQGTKLLHPVFRKRVQYGLPVQSNRLHSFYQFSFFAHSAGVLGGSQPSCDKCAVMHSYSSPLSSG